MRFILPCTVVQFYNKNKCKETMLLQRVNMDLINSKVHGAPKPCGLESSRILKYWTPNKSSIKHNGKKKAYRMKTHKDVNPLVLQMQTLC